MLNPQEVNPNADFTVTPERLQAFFRPRSIALVGATDNSRWSVSIFQNLKTFGFAGPIFCVNPNYEVIHGERGYRRLGDIEEPVDLAFIMVPTQKVYGIMEEVAAAGIRNVAILTSGFAEMGAQGLEMERRILELAHRHRIMMLGPNGNGFVNVRDAILPYSLPIAPPLAKGPVGIVLQSGALASMVIMLAQARHIGTSLFVSMGNETMISATDVMDYLIEDEETGVIAVFLESIRQPATFTRVARKALAYQKPIVALKIGRSEQSARTAKAHTGALVGNDMLNDAVFKQLGIIRVNSLEDLLTTAGLLAYSRPLHGRRMGVVTPSGGACDILSDRAQEEGMLLPDFAPETVRRLQAELPAFSTIHNPLDVTGYIVIDRTLQQRALKVMIDDPQFDFIVYLSEPPRAEPPPSQQAEFLGQYQMLGNMVQQARIPVLTFSHTSIDLPPFARFVSDFAGLHFVGGLEHGLTALGHALWWHETAQKGIAEEREEEGTDLAMPLPAAPASNWPEYITRDFLAAQGIPVVPGVLASSADEAVKAAREFGGPVALKVQGRDLLHKSDIGGVLLNVSGEEETRRGFATLLGNARTHAPGKALDGVLVSPMRPPGIEVLVGIIRDAVWGQILALALGGIWTEVLKDTSVRVLPVRREDIRQMLFELRGAALFEGTRGQQGADIERLVEVVMRITQVARGLRERLESLEINPLLISQAGIEAADALVVWRLMNQAGISEERA